MVALLLAALSRFRHSDEAIGWPLAAAVLTGWLAAAIAIFGPPPWPAVAGRDRLLLLAPALCLACWLLTRTIDAPGRQWLGELAVLLAGLLWLAGPAWLRGHLPLGQLLLPAVAMALLTGSGREPPLPLSIQVWPLVSSALGLSAVALFGRTAAFSQLALALAAAIVGALLGSGRPPTAWLALALRALLLGLGSLLFWFSASSGWALALLLPILRADRLAIMGAKAMRPWRVAAWCLGPAVLAVLTAALTAGSGPPF